MVAVSRKVLKLAFACFKVKVEGTSRWTASSSDSSDVSSSSRILEGSAWPTGES